MSDRDEIKIGFLGAGEIIEKCHLPVIREIEGVSVAWILDRSKSRLERIARMNGYPSKMLLEDAAQISPVDIVVVAIPYGARPSYYENIQTWARGIYVEKPLFLTVKEHRDLISRFPSHAIAHGFQRRCTSPVALLKELVENQTFGRLIRVNFEVGGPVSLSSGSYGSNLALAGGGMLFETGTHWIDLALYCGLATDVRLVEAEMKCFEGFDVDTTGSFSVSTRHSSDFALTFRTTSLRVARNKLLFEFEAGTVQFNPFASPVTLEFKGKNQQPFCHLNPCRSGPQETLELFRANWDTFLTGFRSQTENYTSATNSLLTTKVIEHCYSVSHDIHFG